MKIESLLFTRREQGMIKAMVTGAVVGVLFFCAWSLWKMVFQGAAVNFVYALPIVLCFVLGAAVLVKIRRL